MSAKKGGKSGSGGDTVLWKHIGLRGHSVGTFLCEDTKLVWKSAIASNDVDNTSTVRTVPASAVKAAFWTVLGRSGHVRIQTKQPAPNNLKHELRFDGFPPGDLDLLTETLESKYGVTLQPLAMSSAGTQYGLTSVIGKNLVFKHCVLDEMNEEGQEFEPRAEEEMCSLDLGEVSQCVLPGTNRNEIELQFPESDTVEQGTDQLVAIRMYIPPDLDADPADKAAATAAEKLQQRIMSTANIRKTTGDILVSFEQSKGTFLTPRGRYAIELYDFFLRMRGQKYDYKIKYDDINRLFLLPKPDEVHMAFVIALDKPIRQGQQRYQYLVLQASKEPDEVQVNIEPEALEKEYANELQPVMRGSLANLIAKTFKVIAKKKVFIPGKFANAAQQACVKCAVRANEGLLYPLEKQFVFIHKPPILVRFTEIDSVEFQRYAGGQGSTRNFDLCVNLKDTSSGIRDYTFSGIDRTDYQSLYNFINAKKIKIKNLQEGGVAALLADAEVTGPPVYNEDEIYGGPVDDDEEEEEDEDYDEDAAAKDEAKAKAEHGDGGSDDDDDSEADSDDIDDDELGSEIDEELDSDLEEARKKTGGPTKKRKNKDSDDEDDDDDDDDDEEPKKKKKKGAASVPRKKKGGGGDDSPAKRKKKDPDAPKRAMTSFLMFSNENRDRIKKANPDATVGEVAKLLGAEWKTMNAEKKAKYEAMASKDKKRYQDQMKDYVPPKDSGDGGKGGKGKKAKKDPNAPKRATTAFFYFGNEMRPKIKAQNPDISFGDLGKKLGELFRELSPEEKEKYEKMAQTDKARYKKEMENYKSTGGDKDDDDDDDDDDSDDDSDEDSKPKKKAKAKSTPAKKKPAPAKKKKPESSDEDSDDSDEDSDDDSE